MSGCPIHQSQVANYQEPNEEIKEEKDIYSDSLLPPSQLPMKLEEMKARNSKHSLDPIDLTRWEITCTEFIPRRRHRAIKTPDPDTVFRARTLSSIMEELDQDGNSTRKDDLVGMPVMLSLDNNQSKGPSDTNHCINYGSTSQIPKNYSRKQKIERKRQRKEHKRQQNERKKQIDLIRLEQTLEFDLPIFFHPGISGRDSF